MSRRLSPSHRMMRKNNLPYSQSPRPSQMGGSGDFFICLVLFPASCVLPPPCGHIHSASLPGLLRQL
nr:MAG TPA: virion glycoprotein [Bacteriophage sp.]